MSITSKKVCAGYFPSWNASYPASAIPVREIGLTHVIWTFLDVKSDGSLTYGWGQPQNLNDSVTTLKKKYPDIKVLASIGGATYSDDIAAILSDPKKRETFAQSASTYVTKCNLDGVDVDYEFSPSSADINDFVDLLRKVRATLDPGKLLTAAVYCGPSFYPTYQGYVKDMDKLLDFWNLMAYDYASPLWSPPSTKVGWLDNVFPDPKGCSGADTSEAVKWYIEQGATASKILIGIPLYGYSWAGAKTVCDSYTGPGGPPGVNRGKYDYRALPTDGSAKDQVNNDAIACCTYNPKLNEVVTWDNVTVGTLKGQWIKTQGLGGAFFWDLSGDSRSGDPTPSLVKTVGDAMNQQN